MADEDKVNSVKEMLREVNPDVDILDTSIEEMNISDLLNVIVSGGEIMPEFDEHHHHHDEDEECDCCCGHHHEHHHHHHDEGECCCHDEDECHHEHHHHHHHHDADEDFVNIALRPEYVFDKEELESILSKMDEDVIRVKGYVNGKDGTLYLNYVLNEYHVFYGEKKDESLVVAIGSKLDEQKIREAFHD